MAEYSDLVEQITSPGDAAALLLGGAAGFIIDGVATIHGFTPGTFGIAVGGGLLGIKKAFDSRLAMRRGQQLVAAGKQPIGLPAGEPNMDGYKLLQRSEQAIRLLSSSGFDSEAQRVRDDLALYKEDLIKVATMESTLSQAIETFRSRPQHSAPRQ